MVKRYRTGWWLAGVLALTMLLALGSGGPVAAGYVGKDIEVPGRVFEGGLDEQQRAALARPKRLDHAEPIELQVSLTPFAGEIPEKREKAFGAPLRIGTHRELPPAFKSQMAARDLAWEAARDGGEVGILSVTSPGAKALRLAIDFHRLPRGAEVRFYSPAQPEGALGPYETEFLRRMEKSSQREGPFWSPVISGDTIAVEIWVPSWRRGADVRFSLRKVSHIHYSIDGKDTDHIGRAGSCNKHIECFKKWTTIDDAVAKLVFEVSGGTALCTGQLVVNPGDKSYVVTAAHCISSRREAASVTSFWFFKRLACNGPNPIAVTQTGGGAKLKFTSFSNARGLDVDTTVIEVKRSLPAGVVFAGFKIVEEPEDNIREKVHAIHHPLGDLKMGSRGKVNDVWLMLANGSLVVPNGTAPTHYQTNWSKGTTEGGSSGSGVYCGKKWPRQFFIGVLTGGFASCQARRDPDFYGIFQEALRRFKKIRKLFVD